MLGSVKPMARGHGIAAAKLHESGITKGFLTSLGGGFLTELYRAIPSCPSGFGYVYEDDGAGVRGFVSCAESTGRLYKEALLRRGLSMLPPILRHMASPAVVRRMVETLRYPQEVGEELPAAEVLSIAVDEEGRGKGISTALMFTALHEFARRGIRDVKVAVWSENHVANHFYRKCGFELAEEREHHGLPMSIYVGTTTRRATDSPRPILRASFVPTPAAARASA